MLNDNGTPTTCTKQKAGKFEYSKAQNILKCIPKHLKKFHFKVQAIPDIPPPKKGGDVVIQKEPLILMNENYEIPQSISEWAQRARNCNGLAADAIQRKDELIKELVEISKREKILWHKIQFTKPLNACEGYKVYREIKQLLDRRRDAKDELLIISTILKMDVSSLATDRIQKCVDGLKNRAYTIPDVNTEKAGA